MSITVHELTLSAHKVEQIVLKTGVKIESNTLFVLKCVGRRKAGQLEKEFCISANAGKRLKANGNFIHASEFGSVKFFGDTYEAANAQYLAWFYDVTKNDDKRDKPLMVRHILDNLKLKKD